VCSSDLAETDRGAVSRKVLLSAREMTVPLEGQLKWALVNEGGHGFYRATYGPAMLAALTRNLGELKPIERFGLVSDTWAATVAGLTPLAEFLKMARLFGGETDLNVWRALIGAFSYLDMVAADADRAAVSAAARAVIGPAFQRLGWEPRSGEDELTRQLRGVLAGALGTVGNDPEVQAKARELYAAWEKNPAAADRDIAPALVGVLAHCGDAARYDEFKGKFKSARTPQEEQRYLFSLTSFPEPALLRATMGMALDGQVRTQNAPYLMHSLLLNPHGRYAAWDFMRAHWDEMTNKYPDSAMPRMCEGVIALVEREDEVKTFFAQHRVRLGGKLIDQHMERLTVAANFRRREGGRLASTLKGA